MRSHDQSNATQEADCSRQGPEGVLKTKTVQFNEGQAAGDGDEAGEGDRGKIADGPI
jgi:hypothetical protein